MGTRKSFAHTSNPEELIAENPPEPSWRIYLCAALPHTLADGRGFATPYKNPTPLLALHTSPVRHSSPSQISYQNPFMSAP